jgi:hypothetical protein
VSGFSNGLTFNRMPDEIPFFRAAFSLRRRSSSVFISKGAVSVYGMGRFPVTLYKEQWLKLLEMSDDIRAFIAANEAQLRTKD